MVKEEYAHTRTSRIRTFKYMCVCVCVPVHTHIHALAREHTHIWHKHTCTHTHTHTQSQPHKRHTTKRTHTHTPTHTHKAFYQCKRGQQTPSIRCVTGLRFSARALCRGRETQLLNKSSIYLHEWSKCIHTFVHQKGTLFDNTGENSPCTGMYVQHWKFLSVFKMIAWTRMTKGAMNWWNFASDMSSEAFTDDSVQVFQKIHQTSHRFFVSSIHWFCHFICFPQLVLKRGACILCKFHRSLHRKWWVQARRTVCSLSTTWKIEFFLETEWMVMKRGPCIIPVAGCKDGWNMLVSKSSSSSSDVSVSSSYSSSGSVSSMASFLFVYPRSWLCNLCKCEIQRMCRNRLHGSCVWWLRFCSAEDPKKSNVPAIYTIQFNCAEIFVLGPPKGFFAGPTPNRSGLKERAIVQFLARHHWLSSCHKLLSSQPFTSAENTCMVLHSMR